MHFPKQAGALLLLLGVSSQAKEHTTFSPVLIYRRMQEAMSLPLVDAKLSCVYNYLSDDADGDALKAIDGNTNGDWAANSVAHSCDIKADKWLKIDLSPAYYNYFISNIRIYNRVDCCQTRLVNTDVQILNADGDVIASKEITDLGSNPDVVDVAFDYVTGGESVRFFRGGNTIPINIAEVMVFGVSSTNSPTKSPTNSTTKLPTKSPTNLPTNSPTNSPTKMPTNSPTNSPTPAAAAPIGIGSWALEFDSLSSDFNKDSESEITVSYKIGAGRTYQVEVFKKGCKEEITDA
eukprot:scaffold35103_cov328-Skeletonema_dohrnii-CCMP3373.AAC.1